MTIGHMDRLVTIEQATESRDSTSKAPKLTWTTLGTAFMAAKPMRGRERFAAEQLSAAGDTVWHTHFREDMDPEAYDIPKLRRLSYRGRRHEIVAATHVGMRESLELVTIASQRVTS